MAAPDEKQSLPLDQPLEHQTLTIVGDVQYLVHPQRLGRVSAPSKLQDIIPVTGLTLDQVNDPRIPVVETLKNFAEADDVYIFGFRQRIVIIDQHEPKIKSKAGEGGEPILQEVYGLILDDSKHLLRPGPYFLYNGGLHQAWRLYPDKLRAFNFGVFPKKVLEPQNSAFRPLTALTQDGLDKAIAVPSRLYYPEPSHEKPLAGVRFAVDDLLPVEGVKTTLSHEARATLYGPCPKTCYFIKHLIKLGAVVVGKTKISQLAMLHTAWADVSSPKNPRGDGYQEALGSSPGAGSALSGYQWIDCAVGIDTLGGFIETAEWYGLFALRLSHSWAFLAGMNLASARLSAITFMSRSLKRVQQAANASFYRIKPDLSHQEPSSSPLPNVFIYPNNLFRGDRTGNPVSSVNASLANRIETTMRTTTKDFDMQDVWEIQPPAKAPPREPLESYMDGCAWKTYCYDFAKRHKKFLQDYHAQKKSSEADLLKPYWDDAVEFAWSEGAKVSDEDYKKYCTRMGSFTEWFDEEMASLGESVVLLPTLTSYSPRSRVHSPSAYAPTAHRMQNWDESLASILQRPQLVLPIARIFFDSDINNAREAWPLCVSMMSARNSDLGLLEFVVKLMEKNELEVKVEVGKDALPLANEHWRKFEWSDLVSRPSSKMELDGGEPPGQMDAAAIVAAMVKAEQEEDAELQKALALSLEDYYGPGS
ncbi:amidase signature domain-containing protein [Cercophora samala]|uniref:Amidase signature domain-containing protein n=1 Tax=Cercophora samala TaxID=330535 RepID=A0AA39ZBE5_9PEZI|nr:amidase signature domain-containing protein [Cercophora samala]